MPVFQTPNINPVTWITICYVIRTIKFIRIPKPSRSKIWQWPKGIINHKREKDRSVQVWVPTRSINRKETIWQCFILDLTVNNNQVPPATFFPFPNVVKTSKPNPSVPGPQTNPNPLISQISADSETPRKISNALWWIKILFIGFEQTNKDDHHVTYRLLERRKLWRLTGRKGIQIAKESWRRAGSLTDDMIDEIGRWEAQEIGDDEERG